jgi:hypothetical protein
MSALARYRRYPARELADDSPGERQPKDEYRVLRRFSFLI